ncbi:MAG: S24/S26 family peptidase [candidate division KSB1 bacterium]|nr:S24/S26 family peptidase [candidate division KSB1 bacterium]
MYPFIRNQDVVIIEPFNRRPHLGDVVAFRHPKFRGLAIHRVVGRRKDSFLLKGDNAKRADGWLAFSQLTGCVVQTERNARLRRPQSRLESILIAGLSRIGLLIPIRKMIKSNMPGMVSPLQRIF